MLERRKGTNRSEVEVPYLKVLELGKGLPQAETGPSWPKSNTLIMGHEFMCVSCLALTIDFVSKFSTFMQNLS